MVRLQEKIGVMIVDGLALRAAGMRKELSCQADFDLFEFDPSEDIIIVIKSHLPDVILMHIDCYSGSRLELFRRIMQNCPYTRAVILSDCPNDKQLLDYGEAGAVAYLDSNTTIAELAETIREAYRDEYPINETLLTSLMAPHSTLRRVTDVPMERDKEHNIVTYLTPRERRVLAYIADGNSNKIIAQLLGISEQMVKKHVTSSLRKLGASDRAHAVVLAIRRGLISFVDEEASLIYV
jgi:DNA-binding NarL/FixJ family response regulator